MNRKIDISTYSKREGDIIISGMEANSITAAEFVQKFITI